MKPFFTTGTGSQQTLTEEETNAIPIYDDLTDAEADLSNLEENQIIGTKDNSLVSTPAVDEVKAGVFNPPTSNAVSESLSYSTTEQKTGGVWIDGKPIYRKVFTGNVTADVAQYLNVAALNIENLVNVYGNVKSEGYTTPIGFTSVSANYTVYTYYNSADELLAVVSSYTGTFAIIAEYTKTTDQAEHLMSTREFIEPMLREIVQEEEVFNRSTENLAEDDESDEEDSSKESEDR